MDTIFINDLNVNLTIGCYPWERAVKQQVILNLNITTDFLQAAQQDDLDLSINYEALVNSIIEFCANTEFKLLESLVLAIEKLLLDNDKNRSKIFALEISAKKAFVIANTKEVGVKIIRKYS